MDTADHIACLVREGELLAQAAGRTPLDAKVPACPGWTVRDLLAHVGYVHRWAAGYVADAAPEMTARHDEQDVLGLAPPDGEIVAWFRAGHAALVSTLAAADPGLRCWSFLPAPSPLAFWARRQAHETAIHRIDAQQAAAGQTRPAADGLDPFPAGLAADGIDELLMGFASRNPARIADAPATLGIRAREHDGGTAAWTVAMGPGQPGISRGLNPPAGAVPYCEIDGPAAPLYLLLWNRGDAAGLDVRGDPAPLTAWTQNMQVRWR